MHPLDKPRSAGFPNRHSRLTPFLLSLLWLTGCQSPPIHLTPAQEKLAADLRWIDPHQDPLPSLTPVIDIHAHTFNARYLPLEGILLGKRDAAPPISSLITDHCARLTARALIDQTELSAIPGHEGIPRVDGTQELRRQGRPGPVCRILLGLVDKAIREGAWDPSKSVMEQMAIVDDMAATKMTVLERMAARAAARMMGMGDHVMAGRETAETVSGIQAAVRFLWLLTQNDAAMVENYRAMHAGPPMLGKLTVVSHMMDLGPVYNQCPDGRSLLDFESQQVRRMEHFQAQPDSGLIYFVAYNPYRDFLTNCPPTDSLDLVRRAILEHGARGVKIYPPSGYRPAGNDIRPRPVGLFEKQPKRQWDARYARLGNNPNHTLDQQLERLLEWCIAQDVPVFVHCGHQEFEARRGYGAHHADSLFWQQFLESHSTPGQPCTLRLCLGHAGGDEFWHDSRQNAYSEWGRRVYELCTRYPNVYCEITTDVAMTREEGRAILVERLARLFDESARASQAPELTGVRHPFSQKLMYGTDWYLPDQGRPAAVLLGTQKAFLHERLRAHYADYFSANARRYLKLGSITK